MHHPVVGLKLTQSKHLVLTSSWDQKPSKEPLQKKCVENDNLVSESQKNEPEGLVVLWRGDICPEMSKAAYARPYSCPSNFDILANLYLGRRCAA